MLRIISLPLALAFSSVAYGACQIDSPEIGDVGLDSELICNMLDSNLPHSDIVILGRTIQSNNAVTVVVVVDDIPMSLEYRLVGVDWKLPNLAGIY